MHLLSASIVVLGTLWGGYKLVLHFMNKPPRLSRVVAHPENAVAGEKVVVSAIANDPDGDTEKLSYKWEPKERVKGEGPIVELDTSGIDPELGPEIIRVIVTVTDEDNASKEGDTLVHVIPPPIHVQDIDAHPRSVRPGERVMLTAHIKDRNPDPHSVAYQWQPTGGRIEGDGHTVYLNTRGVSAREGGIQVRLTVRCQDGREDSGIIWISMQQRWLPRSRPIIHRTNGGVRENVVPPAGTTNSRAPSTPPDKPTLPNSSAAEKRP